jgi:mono/diheme cytochrome c family protein
MLRSGLLFCIALWLLAPFACSAEVSFSQVSAIFARQCVMCHQPYDAKGELTLHPTGAWKNVVGASSSQVDMLLVTPGDLEQSYLYRKITNTHSEVGGSGETMPFDSTLTDEQLHTIRSWIEQGAQNN